MLTFLMVPMDFNSDADILMMLKHCYVDSLRKMAKSSTIFLRNKSSQIQNVDISPIPFNS